jgi:hypothetical protein
VPKMLPKYPRFEMCTLTNNKTYEKRGFYIGQECFPANQLCKRGKEMDISRNRSRKKELGAYHPEHMAICQNLTFWKDQRKYFRKIYLLFHNYCLRKSIENIN